MASRPRVDRSQQAGAPADRAGGGGRGGGSGGSGGRPIDKEWLLRRIADLTHPDEPRRLVRKDGSEDVQRKMSARWVRDKLAEEGIHLTLRRVIQCQDAMFERGIVVPLKNDPREEREVQRLEGALKRYFNIPGRVLLVSGFPEMLEPGLPTERRLSLQRQVMLKMAQRLAPFLEDILADAAAEPDADRAGYTVTVGWGRTMRLLAEEIARSFRPVKYPPGLRFQAAAGLPAHQGTAEGANAIARKIASVFGVPAGEMPSDALITRELWELLRKSRRVAEGYRSVHEGRVLITAVGTGDRRIADDERIHNEMLVAVRARHVVANVLTVLLDEDGHEVRTRHVGVGPTYEGLRRMAHDGRHVIVATGGDVDHMLPVLAALRGKVVTDLVSCTVTAAWILAQSSYPGP